MLIRTSPDVLPSVLPSRGLLPALRPWPALVPSRRDDDDDLSSSVAAWFAQKSSSHPNDLLFVVDAETLVLAASATATHLIGCLPAELIGRAMLALVHPDERTLARSAFDAAADSRDAAAPVRARLWHRDGTWRTFDLVMRTIESGRRLLVHARDVTNWQELAGQWNETSRLRTVGELACHTAPDVTSLLEAILLRTDTLLDGTSSGRRGDAAAISGLAQRARVVVGRLLAVVRDRASHRRSA